MRAGLLRQVVTLQYPVKTDGTAGQQIVTWTDCASGAVRASVMPLRGSQFFEAQKSNSDITAKITIRYQSGILPTYRVKFISGSVTHYYEIVEVINPLMQNKSLELMCRETPAKAA